MKRLYLIVLLLTTVIFTNCDQVKLNEKDAQSIINVALNLPQRYSIEISSADEASLNMLLADGVITNGRINHHNNRENFIEISESCMQYNLGQTQNMGNERYVFKTYDFEFDKINGISINKENQTALIRFSLKITNITPFARSLIKVNRWYLDIYKDLESPINGELSFKKFDSGWQLETASKDADTLIKEILKNQNTK